MTASVIKIEDAIDICQSLYPNSNVLVHGNTVSACVIEHHIKFFLGQETQETRVIWQAPRVHFAEVEDLDDRSSMIAWCSGMRIRMLRAYLEQMVKIDHDSMGISIPESICALIQEVGYVDGLSDLQTLLIEGCTLKATQWRSVWDRYRLAIWFQKSHIGDLYCEPGYHPLPANRYMVYMIGHPPSVPTPVRALDRPARVIQASSVDEALSTAIKYAYKWIWADIFVHIRAQDGACPP